MPPTYDPCPSLIVKLEINEAVHMAKGMAKDVSALGGVLAAVEGLDAEQQRWVFSSALTRLGLSLPKTGGGAAAQGPARDMGGSPAGGAADDADESAPTPKAFLRAKEPQSDVQRVVCLAYYLTNYENKDAFNSEDLSGLNSRAFGRRIGNPSQAVDNASKRGYLATVGGGKKRITAEGEDLVNALPDQKAVRGVNKGKRRTRRSRKAKKG